MLQLRSGILAAFVMFSIVWLSLPVRFEVNDDFAALSILSGADGFPAQADVPFISRILNHVLLWLYEVFPNVPWFGGFIYLAAILGCGMLLSLLFFEDFHPLGRLLLAPALLVLSLHCLYSISLTSASLLLLLGTVAYTLAMLKSEREQPRWWAMTACLLFAYLWRWQLSLAFLVFAAPVVLFMERRHWRVVLPLILATVVVVADRYLDYRYNSDPAQQEFRRFYGLRAQFHDRPIGKIFAGNRQAIEAAGWSEDDYAIYRNLWILYDEQAFNSASLGKFLAANQAYQPSLPRRFVSGWIQGIRGNLAYLALVGMTVLGIVLARWNDVRESWGRGVWRDILSIVIVLPPTMFLLYFRFVPRVSIPLLAYLSCWPLLFWQPRVHRQRWPERGVATRWLIAATAVVCVFLAGRIAVREITALHATFGEKRMGQRCLQAALRRTAPAPVLIRMSPGIGLRQDAAHPLSKEPIWNRVRMMPAGWQTGTARYRDILKRLGFTSGSNMLARAINNRFIYFVQLTPDSGRERENLRLWESYYNRRVNDKGRKISFQTVLRCKDKTGRALCVYRCVSN